MATASPITTVLRTPKGKRSIFETLLSRGYFPKELPPALFTDQFARYATTRTGRKTLGVFQPRDNYTECVRYQLARPGHDRRELRIPNPTSFANLASLTAKHFRTLLKKAAESPFSKSRPVFAESRERALLPSLSPRNRIREMTAARAASAFLLKTDISQFYPSLYTHAVGWAINPKLRDRKNWKDHRILGKKLDQALMDLDGKISQGIPIGNDISFLLAEAVLAQVDKQIGVPPERAYRWYDDYELSFETREDAQAALKQLKKYVGSFRLRLNPQKTAILNLPQVVQQEWQQELLSSANTGLKTVASIVKHFDAAFRLSEQYPESPVLLYAIGLLFSIPIPSKEVGRTASSCVSQALLSEPGAAQKAFALFSYWSLNGYALDLSMVKRVINRLILRHESIGFSNDVAWALAFCLDLHIGLESTAAKVLSVFDDDCIAIEALHMHANGLLPKGFKTTSIRKVLKSADLDREHWLLSYESVRQGFLNDSEYLVKAHPVFSDLLAKNVTFYRTKVPRYATVIHPGGAPEWVVRNWVRPPKQGDRKHAVAPIVIAIADDLDRMRDKSDSPDDSIIRLLGMFEDAAFPPVFEKETY